MKRILPAICFAAIYLSASSAIAANKVVVIPLPTGAGAGIAEQNCSPGKYVTGIDASGNIVCNYPSKYIFVTSETYDGFLDGTDGADSRCQIAANSASLGGEFKAWLSNGNSSAPVSAFIRHPGDYITPTGMVVAKGWDGLTSGTLLHSINITEHGGTYTGPVWSNTTTEGTIKLSNNCSQWNTANPSSYGHGGHSNATDSNWTDQYSSYFCDQELALYCVQQ